MEKYILKNIVGQDVVLNINDSTAEKGVSNYPRVGNRITFIEEQQNFFNELFSGFGDKKLTVLDIGSNGGILSIYCAPICDKVYAIEPSAVLCRAIREFGTLSENIVICNCAISSNDGVANFYFFPDCTGQSAIHYREKPKKADPLKVSVNAYTLLSFIKKYKIEYVDICKIDIEGEEVNLFTEETIDALSPYVDKFWIEPHYTAHINGKDIHQNYYEMTELFKSKGYTVKKNNDPEDYGFVARRP